MSKLSALLSVAFATVLNSLAFAIELPFQTNFEVRNLFLVFYPQSKPESMRIHKRFRSWSTLQLLVCQALKSEQSTVDFELNDLLPTGIRWIDFYVKPVFSEATDLPSTIESLRAAVSAFVVEGGEGMVYVIHGNGAGSGTWVSSEYPVALEQNEAKTGYE